MNRPFRFGVQSFNAESGEDWAAQAQTAESLGYSALWVPEAVGRHAFVNSANLLLATDDLVVATGIAGIHNRPAWSTKMAATELDELSGGRFVLGLRRLLNEEPTLQHQMLRGEIARWSRARSGHVYLTLRDDDGSIDAVMWSSRAPR